MRQHAIPALVRLESTRAPAFSRSWEEDSAPGVLNQPRAHVPCMFPDAQIRSRQLSGQPLSFLRPRFCNINLKAGVRGPSGVDAGS